MAGLAGIRFRDLVERETAERNRIEIRLGHLKRLKDERKYLTPDERKEQTRLTDLHAALENTAEVCDPLFLAVRGRFDRTPGLLGATLSNHIEGVLKGAAGAAAAAAPAAAVAQAAADGGGGAGLGNPAAAAAAIRRDKDLRPEAIVAVALTIGLMIVNGIGAPRAVVVGKPGEDGEPAADDGSGFSIVSDTSASEFAALNDGFFAALGKAQGMQNLALLVLPLLAQEGDPKGAKDKFPGSVDAEEFARVMLELVARGITTSEPQLRRNVNQALDRVQSVGQDLISTGGGIDFSQLDESVESDAVPENIRLYGTMICSAMFDELKVFQVVDFLSGMFQDGSLVTSSTGDAGQLLYRYWKDAPSRMTESERKRFYSILMGTPGGNPSANVNREFNDLWLRFLSSATSYVRQTEVDKLLRASLPNAVSNQQVRKAARDLVTNLSAHGYGMATFAAADLQGQINVMLRILNDTSVKASCGARDPWQVVDHYATTELGGARTSTRFRTLAKCGAIITAWLANNVEKIMRPTGPIIDVDQVRSSAPDTAGERATSIPTDYDMINACELWLADTAISDTRVDEMSQPRESPVMTSRPVQIPSIARDMLEGAGVSLGMGMVRGAGNGSSRLNLQS